ncbi:MULTISPECIES: bacteriocin [Streptococcus]|jgi:hypothetical protein|uniref:bacteriocin n=2 Tax=Streptococcus TaxID=1301 RepID=UPI00061DFF9B|nr:MULTISPECIES: bacteriocin [Streptococcus]KJU97843.1 hypothetical protein UA00_00132 [Streptococcus gordonii]MBN2958835.1 bacteriocin [Streptococcus gordonii]MBZ2124082.1 bacteriocin [Streptococcus gordonii]MCY7137375.1 bacteriocin [Streptococcus gordonii]RHE65104.1 bacteriocin [Streptococcus gordonii]
MENMTTIENHYLTLTEDELMNVEGGEFFTATIAGIAVWKIGVAALSGLSLGYLINR